MAYVFGEWYHLHSDHVLEMYGICLFSCNGLNPYQTSGDIVWTPAEARQGSDKGWLRIITKVMDESGGGIGGEVISENPGWLG